MSPASNRLRAYLPLQAVQPSGSIADIAEFINRKGSLPIASRRAFKRVLATIKTIALIHQKQRLRDDMGNVIADYSDYALSYQLVGDAVSNDLIPIQFQRSNSPPYPTV